MVDFRYLTGGEWQTLREARLTALAESPECFLSSAEKEKQYDEPRWRSEFGRGRWIVGYVNDKLVSLAGVTYAPDEAKHYIEYMWVHPRYRHAGIAKSMLEKSFEQLRASGIENIYLWVLVGNENAILLYKKKGFQSTGLSHDLGQLKPGRTEEQLSLSLASH